TRQRTRAVKWAAAAAAVLTEPDLSDRAIAEQVGVSHTTVGKIRNRVRSTGKVASSERTKGRDGKRRPATRKGPAQSPEPRATRPPPPAPEPGPGLFADHGGADEAVVVAAPTPDPDPDTDPAARKGRGKGVALAHEAINCLARIPLDDPLRER